MMNNNGMFYLRFYLYFPLNRQIILIELNPKSYYNSEIK